MTLQHQLLVEHKINKIYNIGNNKPIVLSKFIETIEKHLDKKVIKEMVPMQDGDVKKTWASISKIKEDYNFKNNISLEDGIEEFINWFITYHKIDLKKNQKADIIIS